MTVLWSCHFDTPRKIIHLGPKQLKLLFGTRYLMENPSWKKRTKLCYFFFWKAHAVSLIRRRITFYNILLVECDLHNGKYLRRTPRRNKHLENTHVIVFANISVRALGTCQSLWNLNLLLLQHHKSTLWICAVFSHVLTIYTINVIGDKLEDRIYHSVLKGDIAASILYRHS